MLHNTDVYAAGVFDENAALRVKHHWPLSGDPPHKCAELPSWNWKCCPCFGWASAGCLGVAAVAASGKWSHPRPASKGSTSPAQSASPVDTSVPTLVWFDSLTITKQIARAININTGTQSTATVTTITYLAKCRCSNNKLQNVLAWPHLNDTTIIMCVKYYIIIHKEYGEWGKWLTPWLVKASISVSISGQCWGHSLFIISTMILDRTSLTWLSSSRIEWVPWWKQNWHYYVVTVCRWHRFEDPHKVRESHS